MLARTFYRTCVKRNADRAWWIALESAYMHRALEVAKKWEEVGAKVEIERI